MQSHRRFVLFLQIIKSIYDFTNIYLIMEKYTNWFRIYCINVHKSTSKLLYIIFKSMEMTTITSDLVTAYQYFSRPLFPSSFSSRYNYINVHIFTIFTYAYVHILIWLYKYNSFNVLDIKLILIYYFFITWISYQTCFSLHILFFTLENITPKTLPCYYAIDMIKQTSMTVSEL